MQTLDLQGMRLPGRRESRVFIGMRGERTSCWICSQRYMCSGVVGSSLRGVALVRRRVGPLGGGVRSCIHEVIVAAEARGSALMLSGSMLFCCSALMRSGSMLFSIDAFGLDVVLLFSIDAFGLDVARRFLARGFVARNHAPMHPKVGIT